jgi:hypothetical protein
MNIWIGCGLGCRSGTPATAGPAGGAGAVGGCRNSGGKAVAQAKKVTLYILVVFVMYTIIAHPVKAAEMVQIGFVGISDAAKSVGEFFTGLIS